MKTLGSSERQRLGDGPKDSVLLSLTADEVDTLIDLITFRNQYIHDPPTAFVRLVAGEHIKCWALATVILCNRLVLS